MTFALNTDYYNRAGAEELLERLSSSVLLAQGPMGSMLMSQLDAADVPPAFWNLGEPQTVRRIHQLYAAAGAEVLITNTFQANAPALKRDEIYASLAEVNRAAVDNARAANTPFVLGSVGPAGLDWFKEDSPEYREARAVYRDQTQALYEAGVDAVLLETFTSIRDLQPALVGALDAADGMPVFASFAVNDKGDLLGDGLNIEGAVVYAEKHGAAATGVNCCSLAAANAVAKRLVAAAKNPVMVRPNAGDPELDGSTYIWHEDTEAFARSCAAWAQAGVALIGTCCGATPLSTAAMFDALEQVLQ